MLFKSRHFPDSDPRAPLRIRRLIHILSSPSKARCTTDLSWSAGSAYTFPLGSLTHCVSHRLTAEESAAANIEQIFSWLWQAMVLAQLLLNAVRLPHDATPVCPTMGDTMPNIPTDASPKIDETCNFHGEHDNKPSDFGVPYFWRPTFRSRLWISLPWKRRHSTRAFTSPLRKWRISCLHCRRSAFRCKANTSDNPQIYIA